VDQQAGVDQQRGEDQQAGGDQQEKGTRKGEETKKRRDDQNNKDLATLVIHLEENRLTRSKNQIGMKINNRKIVYEEWCDQEGRLIAVIHLSRFVFNFNTFLSY
jgi:hypothetical protein